MKHYFIFVNGEQKGPFSLEQLQTAGLTHNTPVWFEGLPKWTEASFLDELKHIIKAGSPPKYSPKPAYTGSGSEVGLSMPQKKKLSWGTVLKRSAITIGMLFLGLAIVDYVNSHRGGSPSNSSYIEKVMTVEEIERSRPLDFLNASGTYRTNFWNNKYVMQVTVENKATVAQYKDVVIEINQYSATKSIVNTKLHTFYEYFPPHSVKNYELKIEKHKDANSLGWDVSGAIPQ